MNKKTLFGGLLASAVCAFFLGYPAMEKFSPEGQKRGTSHTDRREGAENTAEEFSNIEDAQDENNNDADTETNLRGVSEVELSQIKLKDSAEYFREAHRKKILEEGGRMPLYRSKEEQKTALQDKLSKKIIAHLKKNP